LRCPAPKGGGDLLSVERRERPKEDARLIVAEGEVFAEEASAVWERRCGQRRPTLKRGDEGIEIIA
jgi:hypothetical protein